MRDVGGFLYEPDGAVIRAGLVTAVAAGVEGGLLDEHIAWVTADAAFRTPFARGYRVLEEVPYREKQLKAALRERGIGRLTIKKRGVDVVPEQLRKRLALRGDERGDAGADPGGRRRDGVPGPAVLALSSRSGQPAHRRPAAGPGAAARPEQHRRRAHASPPGVSPYVAILIGASSAQHVRRVERDGDAPGRGSVAGEPICSLRQRPRGGPPRRRRRDAPGPASRRTQAGLPARPGPARPQRAAGPPRQDLRPGDAGGAGEVGHGHRVSRPTRRAAPAGPATP